MTASAPRSEPHSPTTTIHTLVDEPYLDSSHPATRSRSIMGDSDLVKTTSRHSHLSVVDPEELAVEKAPQDVIWVEWDGPK